MIQEDEHNGIINVTPFIDVVLVLLLVFVAGSAMGLSAINLSLPSAKNATSVSQEQKVNIISITKRGTYKFNDHSASFDVIKRKIKDINSNKNVKNSFVIAGDKDVDYKYVIKIIDYLTEIGINDVGLGSIGEEESLN
jgi:biopolymer transport protein ExbD